ncbi:hypothetical protein SMU26_04691 [Streptococcus mutans 3SN1]|nr:hypothetical protein SMU26_04691 [Streptococcus mutans 3SN1]
MKSRTILKSQTVTFRKLCLSFNIDGSFIPLEDNKWGLRSWYAIDEEIDDVESEEEKE